MTSAEAGQDEARKQMELERATAILMRGAQLGRAREHLFHVRLELDEITANLEGETPWGTCPGCYSGQVMEHEKPCLRCRVEFALDAIRKALGL